MQWYMGPYGPIWMARGEKNDLHKMKQIISDRDLFLGLCRGDGYRLPLITVTASMTQPEHLYYMVTVGILFFCLSSHVFFVAS